MHSPSNPVAKSGCWFYSLLVVIDIEPRRVKRGRGQTSYIIVGFLLTPGLSASSILARWGDSFNSHFYYYCPFFIPSFFFLTPFIGYEME
ncbi:hypothetical protein F4810DRAFT_695819 [Camillea tinctor]|nr:hypothetical protein F4810DRAFT_695819 [Camillea tinctor]